MPAETLCPICGAVVPPNTTRGFCPSCLLLRGVAAEPGAGDLIDDFRLIERIGVGGMGAVYRAEQLEPVRREVAFKLIKPGMDTEEVIARFDAERQTLALMDHPNIARVLEAGATQTGRPYLIMELVQGEPITDFCDQQKLTVRERLELFTQVCHAVQHAHQKGVVHRDLKPSNILVTRLDGRPVPKVIDFGIAKVLEAGAEMGTLVTAPGQVLGTPHYISPEQAAHSRDIDTRTDVYSLGVILYQLLAGATPFANGDAKGRSAEELLRRVREEEPARPSARLNSLEEGREEIAAARSTDPRALVRLVRDELDWIVFKAIDKEREQRYESASALAADVTRYLRNEPVLAGPPSALYRARKFARRNRVVLSTAIIVALALVAGLAVSSWQAVRASRAEALTARRLYYAEMNGVMLDLKEGRGGRFDALRSRAGFVAAAEKFRGWEWYLADALSDRSVMNIRAHTGPARALAATPAGDRLASGGDDGTVRIWSVETGALLLSKDAGAPVRALNWHPNGQVLAVGTSEGRLLGWTLREDRQSNGSTVQRFNVSSVFEVRAHKGAINAVTWTRDGQRIATAGDDGNLIIRDATNKTDLARFSHANAVLAAAWSPDGESIASACGSGCSGVHIWNVAERRLSRTLQDPFTVAVTSLDWNPDGKQLAMGTAHWFVKVFDVQTSKEVFVRRFHRAPVSVVSWSANGKRLLTAADDGTLRVYHFDLGDTHTVLAGHAGAVRSAVWLNGSGVASAGEDGSVRLWPAYDWTGSLVHFRCVPWASGLDFDPGGRLLAVTTGDQPVSVWDVQTGVRLHWLTGHLTPLRGLDWSSDGHLLAAGDAEGNVHVWNALTGESQTNLATEGSVADVEWSPDGQRLLVLGESSSEARVLSVQRTSEAPPATLSFRVVSTIIAGGWSPNGRQIAVGDDRGGLNIIDVQDGRTRQVVPPNGKANRQLSWRPDGNAIALGREDGSLMAVELATGRALWSTIAHRGPITGVCWHPRDRRIATGGQDGAVKLFDADSGEEITVVKQNYSFVSALAWSADGAKLAMGSHDYDLWVYDATPGMERNGRAEKTLSQIRNPKSEIRKSGLGASGFTSAGAALSVLNRVPKSEAIGLWEATYFLRRFWVPAPGGEFDESTLLTRTLRLLDWQVQRDPSACYLRQQRAWILFNQQRWAEAAAEAREILDLPAGRHGNELAGRLARGVLAESLRRMGAGSEALRVLGIPLRSPETPPRLIDLSDFYNASFDKSWLDFTERASNTLASLPRGQRTLQGVPFDLRGIVQLDSPNDEFSHEAHGIPVRQMARRIHFLHASELLENSPPRHVASYVVRFDDGQETEVPIYSGKHLDNWHVPAAAQDRAGGPRIAWLGENPASRKHGKAIALYLFTWENPRPGATVSTLSLLTTDARKLAAPFVVAITVEP